MAPKKKKAAPITAEIKNWYEEMPAEFLDKKIPNPNEFIHHMTIPFRAVVVAPSGSGKSNFITDLISKFSANEGTFASIDIICKDDKEPLYKYLKSKSEAISVKEGLHNLPQLDKFDKDVAHLVVIDDCQLDKDLDRVCQYYIRCRKKSVSILFLAQNYFYIPKVVRNNCSYFVILKVSGQRELTLILKEQGLGLSKEQLLNMYHYATNEKFSPLIVDVESMDDLKKFRKGFDEYLDPANFL